VRRSAPEDFAATPSKEPGESDRFLSFLATPANDERSGVRKRMDPDEESFGRISGGTVSE